MAEKAETKKKTAAKPAAKGEKKPVTKAATPKAAKATKAAAVAQAPAPAKAAAPSTQKFEAHGFRRKLVGRVTSDKMNKTVTVEVVRNAMDPVYKKYVRQRDRYKAHDETNQYKVGDRVEIMEHRPISRDKRWTVIRLVSRPVEE
jgi:small subunit ribosomal protein S17